jgi:hypothetical protein
MTADYLRSRLHYDPETGIFIWKPRGPGDKQWNGKLAGEVAGFMASGGYRRISIDGKLYKAARLAWLYVYGEWPKNHIDHINRVRDDDRLVNLRDVTHTENCNNKSSNNGLPEGVHWHTGDAKYKANIPQGVPVFGRTYLGQYGDPITAGEVVQEGIEIILNNEDDENIRKLLKELKDSRTEVLSEEQIDALRASKKASGLSKGVYKNGGRFQARIWQNGKYVHLGTFNTPEEASEAYHNWSNV